MEMFNSLPEDIKAEFRRALPAKPFSSFPSFKPKPTTLKGGGVKIKGKTKAKASSSSSSSSSSSHNKSLSQQMDERIRNRTGINRFLS